MEDYKIKTLEDIKALSNIEKYISDLHAKKRKILDECEHLDHAHELMETMAYDLAPVVVCVVCGKTMNVKMTDDEKRAVWIKHYGEDEKPDNWEQTLDGIVLDWVVK